MRRSVVVGMAILSVSTAALLLVGSDTPGWQIAAILGSRGLALGLTIQLLLHEAGGTRRRAPRRRAPGGAVGAWHAPVVDHLGAAAPHGAAWPVVFVAFVAVLAAVRVLIGRLYTTTSSLLMAQLLHASSTASVVMLGPPAVSAAQEAF